MKHIAIIMDGNRRFAKKHNKLAIFGHEIGANIMKETCKFVHKEGIPFLTLFAFSSENWNRASDEIEKLNHLLENFLTNETNHFIENKIKVRLIGDLSPYSANIRAKIKNLEEKTTQFEGFTLTIALNYGGRQEIIAGVNTLLKSNLSTISSDDFEKVIYSALLPDVDLMIRTGGAKRISNFLLWKLAYAELYFTDILWPEFNENEFKKALNFFKAQIRNFGS